MWPNDVHFALVSTLFFKMTENHIQDPQRWKRKFSSQIQNNLEILYVPPKSRFLILKFQKISIARDRKIFFSSQIRNNLNSFYAPPQSRFLTLKFPKISITRVRKNFFSSQIRNNLNAVYAPTKALILTRNPVKLTLEPLSRQARLPSKRHPQSHKILQKILI